MWNYITKLTLWFTVETQLKQLKNYFYWNYNLAFGFGLKYLTGLLFILLIDSLLIDDEPLWEPIEWSLVQTWILFIFLFSWIGENLILSRFGGYTGRDKRLWTGWYKTFWLIEIFFLVNFIVTACFVVTPYYFEINQSLPYVYTWWNWLTRAFFLKFSFFFTLLFLLTNLIQLQVRWVFWKKTFLLILLVGVLFTFLLYTNFIMAYFGYWTNVLWYQQTKPVDYIQLSHEPLKWGWGSSNRDHFTYHTTRTVFWYKNDGPFASMLFLFHMYLMLVLFMVYIYWVVLIRRVYSLEEVPTNYLTYAVSSLKQLFYFILFFYFFIFLSFIFQYWRLPIELWWSVDSLSWVGNFRSIILDYWQLIKQLLI